MSNYLVSIQLLTLTKTDPWQLTVTAKLRTIG
jgi:hypothetical protein